MGGNLRADRPAGQAAGVLLVDELELVDELLESVFAGAGVEVLSLLVSVFFGASEADELERLSVL